MLRFGVSGIPRSTARPGTEAGIRRARELGLDCLEMAWVNGVKMGAATAERIAAAARGCDVELTAHGPYAINLCGSAEITRRSVDRLVETGRLAARCGARSFCFHAGYRPRSGGRPPVRRVAGHLARVAARLRREAPRVDVSPELTGRASQLGTLDELLVWSSEIPGVRPCLDFAHQFARQGGACNGYDDFGAMLQQVSDRLGRESLRRLHVHLSGIEYGPRGERRHLPLRASRFRYRDVLRALKDFGASGWVVCESPAREDDALVLQRFYRRLR
jgi:deoxyribonuclease-4